METSPANKPAARKTEEIATDCFLESDQPQAFIQFERSPQQKFGFAAHQLLHYNHEPNPKLEVATPPERLTLAFSTHDVVLFGRQLGTIVELLREQRLASVKKILDVRYANLNPNKTCVTEIKITDVGK
jgi:hypothetical protein